MNYDQFLSKVQEYTGQSKDDSRRTMKAVLECLSQRLTRKARHHLAAQLPKELQTPMLEQSNSDMESLEVFYQRVAKRADLSFHDAIRHSRSVVKALSEAISPAALQGAFAELPIEYSELLGKETAEISASTVDVHDLSGRG